MDKITIIGDGLISSSIFIDAIQKMWPHDDYQISEHSWFGELDKTAFQSKMTMVETEGPDFFEPPSSLLDDLKETNYLFVHIAPVNKKMLDGCQNLKLIGLARGGTENIDLDSCRDKGIPVIRAVKNAEATAEFALGLMLAQIRNIGISMCKLSNGQWEKRYYNDGYRYSLKNLTVGIIGLGNIGTILAEKLLNLGVTVLAFHPGQKKKVPLPVCYKSKEEIFKLSDIISLHLRLTHETENFVGVDELHLMKKTAVLINTARAGLIDEQAFKKALDDGEIAGAALDVFWEEPLPDNHYLIGRDNVTITPHIAGDTDVIDKGPFILLEAVSKWYKGEKDAVVIPEKYMHN